jgi:hypothetical protein
MRIGPVRFFLGLIVASLALGASVFAAATPGPETTPIPLQPKPDWTSMKFLVGTWECSTQSSRRPGPYHTTIVTTMDPTGYWMVQKSATPKVAWAAGINSVDQTTYDNDQHRWVDVYTDDQGGYDVTYSAGWSGNHMVWKDQLFAPGPDIVASSPNTVTKVSDTRTTAYGSLTEKAGRTITIDTVCTKKS